MFVSVFSLYLDISQSVSLSACLFFFFFLFYCVVIHPYVYIFFVVSISLSVNLSFSDISLSVHLPDILLSLVHSIRSARVYDSPAPTCSFPTWSHNYLYDHLKWQRNRASKRLHYTAFTVWCRCKESFSLFPSWITSWMVIFFVLINNGEKIHPWIF